MVEGISVLVIVILFLTSVMSTLPDLCNLSVRTVVKLCTLGFALGMSLVFGIVRLSAYVSLVCLWGCLGTLCGGCSD